MASKRPVGDTSFENPGARLPPLSTGRSRRASNSTTESNMSSMPAYVKLNKNGKAINVKKKKKSTKSRFSAGNTARKGLKGSAVKGREGKTPLIHTNTAGDDDLLRTGNVEGDIDGERTMNGIGSCSRNIT